MVINSTFKVTLISALITGMVGCGGGGSSGAGSTSTGSPTASIASSFAAVPQSGAQLNVTIGGIVTLDGSGSTDPTSTITGYNWTITSKPAGSNMTLSATNQAKTTFTPDVAGDYVVTLTATDASGQSSSQSIKITASTSIPVTNVVSNVSFNGPSTTQPAQDIDLNSVITLDATGSQDPAQQALTISWALLSQPQGSKATLVTSNAVTHLSPDVIGQYQIRARATNANGAYSDVIYTYNVKNLAPKTVVQANATPVGGAGSINAATNTSVNLNAGGSVVPAGDSATTAWTLTSKPAGSQVSLSAATGSAVNFVPDVAGNYVVTVVVTDTTTGKSTSYVMTVVVAQAPTAVVSGSTAAIAQVTAPSLVSSAGVAVQLNGSSSSSSAGSLTYAWSVISKPANSSASITTPAQANISFTPDVIGAYVLQLQVTDANGQTSTQSVKLNVGGNPPVAVVSQSQASVLLGNSITVSAANSYDPAGGNLTYQWALTSSPAGSTATISNATASSLSIQPDVVGTYNATVTVSNGSFSSVAQVAITAITASSGTVPLTYTPAQVQYSRALGKVLIASTNPYALHLVDPVAATDVSIALPAAVKALSLSPDGTLAAVLHEGSVSLVNLNTATLIHSSATGGSQTAAFLTNQGQIYLTGQTGGQWVTPSFTALNGNTGAPVTVAPSNTAYGDVYGNTVGVYADQLSKFFVLSLGLSPAQIYSVSLDNTGALTGNKGSPYWGDYNMTAPLWLSSDQSLLFTGSGTYFNTADLTYAGTLGTSVLSLSHLSSAQELVALANTSTSYSYPPVTIYPSVYKRYTGSLLYPSADVNLPLVANQQSYGLDIYHAPDASHVLVVQTGSNTANAAGVQYYVIKVK